MVSQWDGVFITSGQGWTPKRTWGVMVGVLLLVVGVVVLRLGMDGELAGLQALRMMVRVSMRSRNRPAT
jgi:hypothetical protein